MTWNLIFFRKAGNVSGVIFRNEYESKKEV